MDTSVQEIDLSCEWCLPSVACVVLIKGVWYRDKEVGVERTKEIDDYQSSDSGESGSLVDLKDHFVADVEIGHNELPSC